MNEHFDFKQRVAASFGRAATTYNAVAHVQRDIADELLALLPDSTVNRAMDMGAGTGYCLPFLANAYANAELLMTDLSHGMLVYAEQHPDIVNIKKTHQLSSLVADAERLPLQDNSLDLIVSSLAVQWCNGLDNVLAEAARVLRPGGTLLVNTLIDGTLKEMVTAWATVDDFQHVNQFMSLAEVQSACDRSRFTVQLVRQQTQQRHYQQLSDLTDELKQLGAYNLNKNRRTTLTPRESVQQFQQAYRQQCNPQGEYPITYEVVYLRLVAKMESA